MVTAFITLANLGLLLWAVSRSLQLYSGFFLASQILMLWVTAEALILWLSQRSQILHRSNTRQDLPESISQSQLPAQLNGKLDLEDEMKPIRFQMDQNIDFLTEQSAIPLNERIRFIPHNPSQNQSGDLAAFDELMQGLDQGISRLVIANFHLNHSPQESLISYFEGHTTLTKVICKEISKNTDLIPYLGQFQRWHANTLMDFVKQEAQSYEQVILFLPESHKVLLADQHPLHRQLDLNL